MNCPDCGHDVGANATFCPHCGTRLENAATSAAASPSAAPAAAPPAASAAVGDSSPGSPADRLLGGARRGKHPPEEELWSGGFSPKAMLGPLVAVSTLSLVLLVAVVMFW